MFGLDPSCFVDVPVKNTVVENIVQISCLPSLVLAAANAFLILAGTFALFIIAWTGIRMITSGGDAKQIESFKQSITYAIIGLIVVLSSFAIVNLIGYATKTSKCVTNIDALNTGCI